MKPVLTAKNIRKYFTAPFEVEILKGIHLNLFAGESIAIMGASGEGKSTLLHILGTLEEPTSGELIILGKNASKKPPAFIRNRHIGFVFQAFNLLEDYSVLQNVLMPALIAGEAIGQQAKAYKRATQLLCRVGLEKRIHFPARLLSGGEKQRASIARALCNHPELIMADEPSGNLDHETSRHIHELLISSVKEFNKSLIVVTHDHELASLCDRIFVLCGGYLKEVKN
jgi:lipoprotein-releasing system ATP-binding protein